MFRLFPQVSSCLSVRKIEGGLGEYFDHGDPDLVCENISGGGGGGIFQVKREHTR